MRAAFVDVNATQPPENVHDLIHTTELLVQADQHGDFS
jgi:hypothetical protein